MTIAWYYNDKTKRCIASANTVIQCVTVPVGGKNIIRGPGQRLISGISTFLSVSASASDSEQNFLYITLATAA